MREEPTWLRLDLHVVAAALIVLVLGWAVQRRAGAGEDTREIASAGIRLRVPATWLAEPRVGASAGGPLVVRGEDAVTRVEIGREEVGSELVSVESTLDLARARRYGELYHRLGQDHRTAGGVTWVRTAFTYAFKPTPTHAPRVARAVEYAAPAEGGFTTVVTLHAPEEHIEELERDVLGAVRKEGTP